MPHPTDRLPLSLRFTAAALAVAATVVIGLFIDTLAAGSAAGGSGTVVANASPHSESDR